jgi:hypothetical protein
MDRHQTRFAKIDHDAMGHVGEQAYHELLRGDARPCPTRISRGDPAAAIHMQGFLIRPEDEDQ